MNDEMVKCPKCRREVCGLIQKVHGVTIAYVLLDGEKLCGEETGFQLDENGELYLCPECEELLFTDRESAKRFLKGIEASQKEQPDKIEETRHNSEGNGRLPPFSREATRSQHPEG